MFPLLSHSNKMHLIALLGFHQPKWQIFLPLHILTPTSEIPPLSWTWGLYKVPLSGGASLYRALWGVPPGSKHYSGWCRKNIPNQVIKWSRCERYNNREEVARKATRTVFSISSSLLFIHVPTMPAYILNIYALFSPRIQVAGGRCNVTGEYFERGFTSE